MPAYKKGECGNPKGRPKGVLGPHKIKLQQHAESNELWDEKKLEGKTFKPTRDLWTILDQNACNPAYELTLFAMNKVTGKSGYLIDVDPKLRLKALELLFKSTYAQLKSVEVKGAIDPKLFFSVNYGEQKKDGE